MMDALRGSASDVRMQFNVWYNQRLIYPNVPVSGWSISWDKTRQIMGQGTFAVLDPDALMIPWRYRDPLNVGGGHMQAKIYVGRSSADLGYLRITRSEPDEKWKLYEPNGVKLWVSGTHTINVQADDRTTMVQSNKYIAPETAPAGATVFSEFARVVAPFMMVMIDPALTDRPVPSTVVYSGDRMGTLQQLADAISAGLRVTGSGQLSVYKPGGSSLWTFQGGSHDANLNTAKRSSVYAGLYNGVVSRNTLPNGSAIQATSFETGGDLAWGGPHGQVLYEHQASFATDQNSIQADADTSLRNLILGRNSTMTFSGNLHPGIETGDPLTVMMPLWDGTEWPLQCITSAVTIKGTGNVNPLMDFTVTTLDSDLAAAGDANLRGR